MTNEARTFHRIPMLISVTYQYRIDSFIASLVLNCQWIIFDVISFLFHKPFSLYSSQLFDQLLSCSLFLLAILIKFRFKWLYFIQNRNTHTYIVKSCYMVYSKNHLSELLHLLSSSNVSIFPLIYFHINCFFFFFDLDFHCIGFFAVWLHHSELHISI